MLKGANLKGGGAPAPPIDQPPLFCGIDKLSCQQKAGAINMQLEFKLLTSTVSEWRFGFESIYCLSLVLSLLLYGVSQVERRRTELRGERLPWQPHTGRNKRQPIRNAGEETQRQWGDGGRGRGKRLAGARQ